MLASFEAGELVEGFQGRGGGLVPDIGGVEFEQVALEADVLLDDFGIALDDDAGPMSSRTTRFAISRSRRWALGSRRP